MSKPVVRTTALAMVAALSLAACSSSGGKKATETSASGGAGKANTPRMTISLITHSGPGDTFWDLVRKGAQAAADKDNVQPQYAADPDGTKQAALVQSAVDKKVDGIALTLAKPDAMKGAVKNAVNAKIPVVGLNSGSDVYQSFGMLGFFGQPEKTAGEAVGDKIKAAGAKAPLCIIHEQGNVGLEDRCAGVKEKVPGTQTLYVNGKDLPSVLSSVTAKLQQDKKIDWVIGLNADITLNAVKAKKAAGSSAKVGTFDTNADLVKAIQSGDIEWAVDQQPYLQGYLAVDSLWLYKTNGDTIGGGQPTLTGPAFVDKSNVDAVAKFAAGGTR